MDAIKETTNIRRLKGAGTVPYSCSNERGVICILARNPLCTDLRNKRRGGRKSMHKGSERLFMFWGSEVEIQL